ncbi:hypothetical protein O206_19795 [Ochrobactrum sp. EGD-AQ16]|nr:hypothetical protein O206_19795 [Ochrobactrum sp. EGD-AQ16]
MEMAGDVNAKLASSFSRKDKTTTQGWQQELLVTYIAAATGLI